MIKSIKVISGVCTNDSRPSVSDTIEIVVNDDVLLNKLLSAIYSIASDSLKPKVEVKDE